MSDEYPRPETPETEAPAARNPVGWIVLSLLFAYMVFNALGVKSSKDPQSRLVHYGARLRTAMATFQAGDNPVTRLMTGEESADAPLRKIVREAAPGRLKDSVDAAAWGVAQRALGKPVEKEVLDVLTPRNGPLVEALSGKPKDPEGLIRRLEARGPISKAMADEVRWEAGLSKSNTGAVALLFLALLLASGGAWVMTIFMGVSGVLRSLGPALEVRTGAAADGLALRAAMLLAAFLGLQIVAAFIVAIFQLDSRAGQALGYGAMLVAVPTILRRSPSMEDVGLTTRNLGRNVLLGLWAFLLELPVTGLIAIVCAVLLRNFPTPEHPASNALMGSPDIWTVAVIFFGGAVVAPFWEETMFRGLLFPAFKQVLRGPIPAALLTSFFFASIHPQGPVLWAALATVALFSCFLAQKTRSLVPSVVMHFAHNATLLALTVAMGR